MGKTVGLLDFPRYKHQSGFMVSKYLNGEYGSLSEVSAELGSMFYAIDRFDAKAEAIEKLATCDYVIANRYVSSNMIHQATKMDSYAQIEKFLDWVYDLEYKVFGIPKPDVICYLKISPETSHRLVSMKDQRDYIKGGENKDLHEKDTEHTRRAIELALFVASKYTNWKIIECEENNDILPKEIITERILKKIM